MRLFICHWKNRKAGIKASGFVRANGLDDAKKILQENLQAGYEVTDIEAAHEDWITPQSLTVNFPNPTEYTLFD